MGAIIVIRRKISLIYRENSFTFATSLRVVVYRIRGGIIGRNNNFAAIPTLEEGLLHKNKLVLNCLT
jgi:hypothetical protein